MKKKNLLAAAVLSGFAATALAQDYPAPIQSLQDKGIEILDSFTAPGGYTGYVALYQGMPLALYLTADQQHAIAGTMIDGSGADLTKAILDEKVNLPQSARLWERLEQDSHWIGEGNPEAGKKVYVFTDPNCPYCKRLWRDMRPWIEAGNVEVRHIPVGVLGAGSEKKSAYIISAKDPLQALVDNESETAAAKEIKITPAVQKQLDDNLRLMQQLGASGTPAIFFRDENGLLQLHPGAAMGEELVYIFAGKP